MSFDTSALQSLVISVANKTGNVLNRISTLDPRFAGQPTIKPLIKQTAETAKAFNIDLEVAGYTFTAKKGKEGNIRVYSPRIGLLGGVVTIYWGNLLLPLATWLEVNKEAVTLSVVSTGEKSFALSSQKVDGKKVISGSIGLQLPKASTVKLNTLQAALGDDDSPMTLDKVLGNLILDSLPALSLSKFPKGTNLNLHKWVKTSNDHGGLGYVLFYETGETRFNVPKAVKNEIAAGGELPDLEVFEEGDFLVTILGVGDSPMGKYLQTQPVRLKGYDLSAFGGTEDFGFEVPAEVATNDLEDWGDVNEVMTEY